MQVEARGSGGEAVFSVGAMASMGRQRIVEDGMRERPLYRAQATLRGFDAGTYTASVQLWRGPDVTLASIPVSRAIAAVEMVAGRSLAVLFNDQQNASDAMVVGVW